MPGNEATWTKLDQVSPSVKAAYWDAIPTFVVDRSASLSTAAEHLIAAGRARAAVRLLGHRIAEKPTR